MRRLYRGVDEGYDIPRDEERVVRAARGDPLYGELMPSAVTRLIDWLDLGERDVFYDLGSGTGKVVLQAAMTVPLRRCVGVELSSTRCRIARAALRSARREGLIRSRRTVIRERDLLQESLADATVVYTCSTAFSLRTMRRLVRTLLDLDRDLRFVTLQEPEPRRRVEPDGELRLATNWSRRTAVHAYRIRARG